jgi:hypothetical protein
MIPVKRPAMIKITTMFRIVKVYYSPGSAKQNRNPKNSEVILDIKLILL